MSIALKGALTGLFQGLGERFDEERKQTAELIAIRTKNAFQNYQKYQEEKEALKEEVKKRDLLARQFQADLSDKERIAIATLPNALEIYKKAVEEGRQVNGKLITLRDVLQPGDQLEGMTYDAFVASLDKGPEPLASVPMEKPTSVFAPSEERQRQMMERLTRGVGLTPEQVMAFEQPRRVSPLEPMGSISMEKVFAKQQSAFTSLEQQANAEAVALRNETDPDRQKMLTEQLAATQEALRAHKEATTARTAEEKQRSVASITSSARDYINARMIRQFGVDWAKFTEAQQVPLGDGRFFEMRGARTDLSPEKQKEILDAVQSYARNALKDNKFLDDNGQPIYDSVREVMVNFGILGTPARTTPAARPAAGTAPTTAPVAGTSPAPATRSATPSTASPTIDPSVVIINGVPTRFPSPQAARDAQAEILRRTQGTR